MITLKAYEDDFYTGRTRDSRQAVMGLLCPTLVAYFFSRDGTLLEREARPWNYPAPRSGTGIYNIYDKQFRANLAIQLQSWQTKLGFYTSPITIEPFDDEEQDVWAGHDEDNDLVFYWAKEYFLAPDGEVEST